MGIHTVPNNKITVKHLERHIYGKIPIISPGLIFVQKAFKLGLFSGELIFGGAYYWKEFCVSKWVGLDNKTASTNSPSAYIWEGLLSEGVLRLRFWVLNIIVFPGTAVSSFPNVVLP